MGRKGGSPVWERLSPQILDAFRRHRTYTQAAEEIGCHRDTIKRYVERAREDGEDLPPPVSRGISRENLAAGLPATRPAQILGELPKPIRTLAMGGLRKVMIAVEAELESLKEWRDRMDLLGRHGDQDAFRLAAHGHKLAASAIAKLGQVWGRLAATTAKPPASGGVMVPAVTTPLPPGVRRRTLLLVEESSQLEAMAQALEDATDG